MTALKFSPSSSHLPLPAACGAALGDDFANSACNAKYERLKYDSGLTASQRSQENNSGCACALAGSDAATVICARSLEPFVFSANTLTLNPALGTALTPCFSS